MQEQYERNEVMNIIITMAGVGSRFRDAGYTVPKYMIEARGKTLFEWSMESLADYQSHAGKYFFVVRKEDNASGFIQQKCQKMGITDFEIMELSALTDGQATTAMIAVKECEPDESIMIYNIDTYVEAYEMKFADIHGDGYIPCFHADGNHWSFVQMDDRNRAIEVREKVRISDNCTLGAYYFGSAALYMELYEEYYSDDIHMEKNEKYIAPLYNYMLSKNMDVYIGLIDASKVHVLGTPAELELFIREADTDEKSE